MTNERVSFKVTSPSFPVLLSILRFVSHRTRPARLNGLKTRLVPVKNPLHPWSPPRWLMKLVDHVRWHVYEGHEHQHRTLSNYLHVIPRLCPCGPCVVCVPNTPVGRTATTPVYSQIRRKHWNRIYRSLVPIRYENPTTLDSASRAAAHGNSFVEKETERERKRERERKGEGETGSRWKKREGRGFCSLRSIDRSKPSFTQERKGSGNEGDRSFLAYTVDQKFHYYFAGCLTTEN